MACPGFKRIEYASAIESQFLIALAGGEVIYFELDSVSGNLTEATTRDMGADICCLDVGTLSTGRGSRQTIRIVSLEPNSKLVQRSSTSLKSRPHSVTLQIMTVCQRPPPSPVAALIAAKEETAATVVLSKTTIVPPVQHSLVKIQILEFKLHVGFESIIYCTMLLVLAL